MAAYAAELAVTAQGRAVYERSCSVQLHVPAQGGVCMRRVGMGSERGEGKDAHGDVRGAHHFTRTSRGKRVLSLVCNTLVRHGRRHVLRRRPAQMVDQIGASSMYM